MRQSFKMTRAQVADREPDALRAAIVAATGSEDGAESILRSLERMGTDPSIDYFEMTEISGSRRMGGSAPAGWRVRADRGLPVEPTG